MAVAKRLAETGSMQGFGERLKARARELGLSDSEVARRLGLSQARYSHYVNGVHEPDLATLARIVRALAMTADQALGLETSDEGGEDSALRARLSVAAASMDNFACEQWWEWSRPWRLRRHPGPGRSPTRQPMP